MLKVSILLLFATLSSVAMFGQDTVARVYADQKNQVHVVYKTGRTIVVAGERGEVGIDSIQIAEDGRTAGWLVLYENPDGGSPVAGKLVLWRSGKVMRRVDSDQTSGAGAFMLMQSRLHTTSVPRMARPHHIANFMTLKADNCWRRGMVI